VCAPESNPRWVLRTYGWRSQYRRVGSRKSGFARDDSVLAFRLQLYCNSPASRYYRGSPNYHRGGRAFTRLTSLRCAVSPHAANSLTPSPRYEDSDGPTGIPSSQGPTLAGAQENTEPRPQRARKQHAYWSSLLVSGKSLTVVAFQRSLWAPGKKNGCQRAWPTQPFKLDALTDYMVCAATRSCVDGRQ